MATRVQKAHKALLLKALLVRALRSLSPLYADLKTSIDYIQSDVEDLQQSQLVPAMAMVDRLDSFIKEIEQDTGREFKETESKLQFNRSEPKSLSLKISKSLRGISAWATKASRSVKMTSNDYANKFDLLSVDGIQKAINFEDIMLPESTEQKFEKALLIEYRKLARLV